MSSHTSTEKALFLCSVIAVGILTAGTKGCQEDYFFAAQVKATPAADPTSTPSPTPTDEGDDLITATPTRTATPTATGSVSPTPTRTPTPASAMNPLVSSLAVLGTRAAESPATTSQRGSPVQANSGATAGNWLGDAFADKGSGAVGEQDASDSDDDGFADWLEERLDSDPLDGRYIPLMQPTTDVSPRLINLGTSLSEVREEIRVQQGAGPRDGDIDGDGLLNTEEQKIGSDPRLKDSDGDGLPDDIEARIKTSVRVPDSDGDGILDGREIQIGSDPLVPEWR